MLAKQSMAMDVHVGFGSSFLGMVPVLMRQKDWGSQAVEVLCRRVLATKVHNQVSTLKHFDRPTDCHAVMWREDSRP